MLFEFSNTFLVLGDVVVCMIQLSVFSYSGPESTKKTEEVVLQEKVFEDDETVIAHIYPDAEVLFIETDRESSTPRKPDIPLDVNHFIPNRDEMYDFIKKFQIDQLSVIPPTGRIKEVSALNELNRIISNCSYPIEEAELNIDGDTAFYLAHDMVIPKSVDKEKMMDAFVDSMC